MIDTEGRIWVGFFDEGVFGNFGWNHPGPTGLGAAGLVALDDHGEVLWRFNEDQMLISDCYALNVHRPEVWAYYDTDFELARVDGTGRPDVLGQAGVFGASALAVSDQAVRCPRNIANRATVSTWCGGIIRVLPSPCLSRLSRPRISSRGPRP